MTAIKRKLSAAVAAIYDAFLPPAGFVWIILWGVVLGVPLLLCALGWLI